jgi:uncharacterized glyoxalase superfamily protein PhnB
MAVKPIPDGYHTITPYLVVEGVPELIEFLKQVFDAEERYRTAGPDGTIRHAEVRVGDSMLMLSEATDSSRARPGTMYLYVEDVDAAYGRAVQAGATSLREPTNEFYGDRSCGVQDASGMQWWIATHVEDVSSDDMAEREKANSKEA